MRGEALAFENEFQIVTRDSSGLPVPRSWGALQGTSYFRIYPYQMEGLFLAQISNTRQDLGQRDSSTVTNGQMEDTHLSFQQLEAGTPTGTDVTELIFRVVLCDNGRGVSSPNNDYSAILSGFDVGIEEILRSPREGRELEHAGWAGFY